VSLNTKSLSKLARNFFSVVFVWKFDLKKRFGQPGVEFTFSIVSFLQLTFTLSMLIFDEQSWTILVVHTPPSPIWKWFLKLFCITCTHKHKNDKLASNLLSTYWTHVQNITNLNTIFILNDNWPASLNCRANACCCCLISNSNFSLLLQKKIDK
jgi:hypothetical protein